ncbi:MAG: DUF1761 domain-containing protein [Micropepsaceae bacterium]
MPEINWIGGAVAGIAGFVLGGVWYSALFANVWMREHKLTKEGPFRYPVWLPMLAAVGTSIAGAFVLSWLLGPAPGVQAGVTLGAVIGFLVVAGSIKMNGLFAQDSPALVTVEAMYPALQYTLMGLILGLWP